MYMLWGGGSPFTIDDPQRQLRDSSGTKVSLLGSIGNILHQLNTEEVYKDTIVAWVSCTDEPSWADECLHKFVTTTNDNKPGRPLIEMAHSSQIYKANKKTHFQRLHATYPDINYNEMIFFDNESGNIRSVSQLGVQSVYCPDGMLQKVYDDALLEYQQRREQE